MFEIVFHIWAVITMLAVSLYAAYIILTETYSEVKCLIDSKWQDQYYRMAVVLDLILALAVLPAVVYATWFLMKGWFQ